MDREEPRKGVPHARILIAQVIADIEGKAQASPFKDSVIERLREALHHMWRNIEKRPSKRISRPVDREVVQSVLLAIIANPRASRKEIGDTFGIQSGRVTEIWQGKHNHLLSPELVRAWEGARGVVERGDNVQLPLPSIRRSAA